MVGERNLVESHNARVYVTLERRLSHYLSVRKKRKDNNLLNLLELSVLNGYKDEVLYDAERALAVIGEGVLLPMYEATYLVEHLLQMSEYYVWLDNTLEKLIDDRRDTHTHTASLRVCAVVVYIQLTTRHRYAPTYYMYAPLSTRVSQHMLILSELDSLNPRRSQRPISDL